MSDTGHTPTELREEVEEELDDFVEKAGAEGRDRMSERDIEGVDEPNDDVDGPSKRLRRSEGRLLTSSAHGPLAQLARAPA